MESLLESSGFWIGIGMGMAIVPLTIAAAITLEGIALGTQGYAKSVKDGVKYAWELAAKYDIKGLFSSEAAAKKNAQLLYELKEKYELAVNPGAYHRIRQREKENHLI